MSSEYEVTRAAVEIQKERHASSTMARQILWCRRIACLVGIFLLLMCFADILYIYQLSPHPIWRVTMISGIAFAALTWFVLGKASAEVIHDLSRIDEQESYTARLEAARTVIRKRAKSLVSSHNSRAKYEYRVDSKIHANEWIDLCESAKYACMSCHRMPPDVVLSLDHVVPLSLGGDNTIANVQVLCWACNTKKGSKNIDYRSK